MLTWHLGTVGFGYKEWAGAVEFGGLEKLLVALAPDRQFAVELRNRSWGTPATLDLLQAHGVALVAAEYATRPGQIFVTSNFLYIRWVGERGRPALRDRAQVDAASAFAWWRQRIAQITPAVPTAWGFVNNDYSDYAIATAQIFTRMANAEQ